MSALDSTAPHRSPASPAAIGLAGQTAPVLELHRWDPTLSTQTHEDAGHSAIDPSAISYEIDARGLLSYVSDGWDLFALANGAPQLRRRNAIGQNFWDVFADEETLSEHHAILERCRERDQMGTYLFRCDAPFERRLLRMQIRPLTGGGFRFDSHTVATQRRSERVYDAVMRLAPAPDVARCSHCNRFRFGHEWFEPEHVTHIELEHGAERDRARMIHTLCPTCRASMRAVPELVLLPRTGTSA